MMKRFLLTLGLVCFVLTGFAQINIEFSDTSCSNGAGVTNTVNMINPKPAASPVVLGVWNQGDLNTQTIEWIDVFSENGYNLGRVFNPIQCGSWDSTNITVPLDSFNDWLADGTVTFDGFFSPGTGFCSPNECFAIEASYTALSGPNDAGVTSTAAIQSICPGSNPVSVTIQNFGTNQIDSVMVHWEMNGVAQPTVNYNATILDTFGGTGSSNAIVTLGNFTFAAAQNYTLRAWTSMPNNTADSTNLNDTLVTTLSLINSPSGLGAINVFATTADIVWNAAAGTNYRIIYGIQGFDPATAGTTISSVSASPQPVTGLSGNTFYDVYIMADCGSGVFSDTAGPASFRTACTLYTAPFSENFDNPTLWIGRNTIDPCWSATPNPGTTWSWEPRSTAPTSGNGPLGDLTGGNYMYCEASLGGTFPDAELVSPIIDVSGLTTPALYFYHHRNANGGTIADMDIEVSNDGGTSWTNVFSVTGQIQTANGDPWEFEFVNLSAYTGDTIQLKFLQTFNGCCGDAAIDSVVVDEAPTCAWPSTLANLSTTSTTASFSWIDPTGTAWDIEYGAPGFTPGTGAGTIQPVTTNPGTITGLTAATVYDAYIRTNCTAAGNGTSIWIGPVSFSTLCTVFSAPFVEDFDTTTWVASGNNANNALDPCWSSAPAVTQNTEPFKWIPRSTGPTSGNGPLNDVTGGNFMYCEASGSTTGDSAYLQSPAVDIGGLISPGLYFMHHRFSNGSIADMEVRVSNDFGATWATLYSVTGDLQNASNDPWIQEFVNLGAYAGDTVIVRFIQNGNGCCGDAALDSVAFGEAPACPNPSNFINTATSSSTATFSFIDPSGITWDIEYGAPGFALGTGTSVSVTSNPATISNLTTATTYEAYLRTNCTAGGNGTSAWIGPVTFTTLCTIFTAPYTENFDSTNWVASGGNAGNSLDPCWISNPDVSQGGEPFKWIPRSTGPTSGNGPLTDVTGGNFMYCEASGSTSGDSAYLQSPAIDVSGLTTPGLYFMQHRFSNGNIADLEVRVSGDFGATWASLYSTTGDLQASANAPWELEFINLGAYTGDTVLIRFIQKGNGCCGDAAIDSVVVDEAPTCPWPSNFASVSTTSTTATFDWLDPTNSTWDIEYGAPGFALGSGTVQTVSTNPGVLTGLTSGTVYQAYIRANCTASGNGSSIWVGPINFTTLCNIFTAPFAEDFDGSTWTASGNNANNVLDPCWTSNPDVTQNGEPFKWIPRGNGPTSGNGPLTDKTGLNFMYVEASGSTNGDSAYLQTPAIDVSGLTTPALFFEQHRNANGGTIADMKVLVSNDFGASWTQEYTITGETQTAPGDDWELILISLPNYVGDTILIRFVQNGNGCCGDAAIDDVKVDEAPTCLWPNGVSLNSTTDTSATITIDDPLGTEWDLEWGPVGFSQGTGTLLTTTSLNDTLTSLLPNTCYDVYVRANCISSGNGTSIWRGPLTFCTQCAPFTVGYFQNFDGTQAPELDNCWSPIVFNIASTNWEVQTDAFRNFSPNNSLEIHNSNVTNGTLGAASPMFSDLDSNKRIEFYVYDEDGQFTGSDLLIGTMTDISNAATLVILDTITEAEMDNDVWEFFQVDLFRYPNTGPGHVVFVHGMNSTFDNLHVDDFRYINTPACAGSFISSLGVTGVTTSSALATWSGGQGDFTNVEWGNSGFTPGVGASIGTGLATGADTTLNMTGLQAQTTYDFYIQDTCITAGTGVWVGPFTFTTACLTFTAPFFEDFDGSSWTAGTGFTNAGFTIDPCWNSSPDQNSTVVFKWGPRSTPPNSGNGPLSDHTGGNFMYCEASTNGILDAELITPAIDVSSLSIPALYFRQHRNGGGNMADMDVEVSNDFGVTWSNVYSVTGQIQTGAGAPWVEEIVTLSAYIGDTILVRFYQQFNGCCSDAAIDSVAIDEAPSCPAITGVNISNLLDTSATVNWVGNPNTLSFEVWYGPAGFFQGTMTTGGTRVFATGSNTAINGLIPQTCYDYLVRGICQPGDTGAWVGPETFCTPCSPAVAPYYENFDGVIVTSSGVFNNCWTGVPEEGTTFPLNYAWEGMTGQTPNFNTGPNGDATSGNGNYLFTASNNGAANDIAELYSPLVDITALTNPEVRFSYHMFGFNIDTLWLDVFDGATWTNSVFSIGGSQQTSVNAAWRDTTISLAAFASNPLIQVKFRARKDLGFASGDISIDEVFIDDPLTCFQPSNISASSITQSSASVSWTTGGASNWQVQYDTTGFALGTGTIISNATNPVTITGLMSGTAYQVYVRDSCGPGDVSFWHGPYSFTTACAGILPINLPYTQGFENLVGTYRTAAQLCDGTSSTIDYSNTDQVCRLRFEAGAGFYNTGSKAATLDRDPAGAAETNFLVMTVDMTNYVGNSTIWMRFYYMHHGEENHPNDKVWVRGNSSGTWVQVYDLWANRAGPGNYKLDSVDVSTALSGAGQAFSSTFQVRYGQEDTNPATSPTGVDGYTFDDITLYDASAAPIACPDPTAVSFTINACNDIDLTWTSSVSTVNSEVEWGPTGFTPGTGAMITNTTSPTKLTTTIPNTSFDFYVRDICATDTSNWVGPITFNSGSTGAPVANIVAGTPGAPTLIDQTIFFDGNGSTGTGNSYAWDFGDGNTGSGDTITYGYTSNGTFTVTLTVSNACGTDSTTVTVTTSGIGLQENILSTTLQVYPNPSNDFINISFDGSASQDATIRLLDLSGREVISNNVGDINGQYQGAMDIQSLADGIYMLEIESGQLKATRRVIKN